MDGDRFDALARTLGAGRSRRGALKTLLGGALGGAAVVLGGEGAGAAPKPPKPPAPQCCPTGFPTLCGSPGTCTNTMGDASNCGACGHACTTANGTPACNAGACGIASCNTGFADCNRNPADGCEVNTATDSNNCGMCGKVCAAGSTCVNSQCASTCIPTTCAALGLTCGPASDGCGHPLNCNDGQKDGTETDIDCGGNAATCPTRCAQGQRCQATGDCASGLFCVDGYCCDSACNSACHACSQALTGAANGTCAPVTGATDPRGSCADQGAASCGTNGTCQNGACADYPNGTTCAAASCAGNTFTAPSMCNGSGTCTTGAQTICQGATPFCNSSLGCVQCLTGSDCLSKVCTGNVCQAATCSDGVQNGTETDIDCGGTCPKCVLSQKCLVNSDCASNACDAISLTCVADQCADHRQDGNETDVDCGGGTCAACANGLHCQLGSDCVSGICSGGVCAAGVSCAGCLIGGVCYQSGATNPSNTCQVCNPGTSTTTWSNEPNTTLCPVVNGSGQCQSGVCTGVVSCNPGYLDCDGNASNGCETNVATDPNNCGVCLNQCTAGHACVGGTCQ